MSVRVLSFYVTRLSDLGYWISIVVVFLSSLYTGTISNLENVTMIFVISIRVTLAIDGDVTASDDVIVRGVPGCKATTAGGGYVDTW